MWLVFSQFAGYSRAKAIVWSPSGLPWAYAPHSPAAQIGAPTAKACAVTADIFGFELDNPAFSDIINLTVSQRENLIRGRSSSGRAPPCQGGGSEFEPRRPLHVGTSCARSDFLFHKNQSPASLFLLFRKKSRCACAARL